MSFWYCFTMSDEPDNLVLHYLRRIDARVENMVLHMSDIKARLSSVERQMSDLHSELAVIRAD